MESKVLTSFDPPLTGVHATDQEILLHLNDESLSIFFSVSKSAQILCDETFWLRKFVKEFGTNLEESKKNGIEINYKNIYGQLRNLNNKKLFDKSAKNGYIDLVKRLIELKRVEMIHGDNDNALRLASRNGHLDVVKYLIEHGGLEDPSWSSRAIHSDNDRLLQLASVNGHLDVVKYLIKKGAGREGLHAKNDYALRLASEIGHLDVLKYLIEQSGLEDPSRSSRAIRADNDIALRVASLNGHLDVVKYLIEHGANITVLSNITLPANISNYLKSISENNQNGS